MSGGAASAVMSGDALSAAAAAAPAITIAGRRIARDAPPFIIAELSGNHRGELGRALALVDAAHRAGADAIKLQTYTPDTLTIDHDGPGFVIESGLWRGRTLYDLYREAQTPWAWHQALFDRGRALGVPVFSSPFDETAVAFLETLDPPAFKIASFELTDLPLIRRIGQTGKPVILSTGMADLGEIAAAVATLRRAWPDQAGDGALALLHCVSGYPTPAAEADLRTIAHLGLAFGAPAGLSDHSDGVAVAVAAVALGAVIIEKHLTLDRAAGGPDAAFSLEPHEFAAMAAACRTAWRALGRVSYDLASSERDNRALRRSLYVVRDLRQGAIFTADHVRSIRPGHGLPPDRLDAVIGRAAARDLTRGSPLGLGDVLWRDAVPASPTGAAPTGAAPTGAAPTER